MFGSRAGTGPGGYRGSGVTVSCGRSSGTVRRQLSSRCAVVRMVATAGYAGRAGARCRTMSLFGRRGPRQAGRPAGCCANTDVRPRATARSNCGASRPGPEAAEGPGAPLRGPAAEFAVVRSSWSVTASSCGWCCGWRRRRRLAFLAAESARAGHPWQRPASRGDVGSGGRAWEPACGAIRRPWEPCEPDAASGTRAACRIARRASSLVVDQLVDPGHPGSRLVAQPAVANSDRFFWYLPGKK